MDETFRELAEAYANKGNAEGVRFVLGRWARVESVPNRERARLNSIVRDSAPTRIDSELEYAALEGQPVAFAAALREYRERTDAVPDRVFELEDICYEHALYRWYADRKFNADSIDIALPPPQQKALLLARLVFGPEQEARLDACASNIADTWMESVERPVLGALSLETYLEDRIFDPRLCA